MTTCHSPIIITNHSTKGKSLHKIAFMVCFFIPSNREKRR
ncbi:hypothetical protein HMPREF0262_00057 [Clostridium sp. ATCC 29733]|nr:hypothetical protein HMPREF0262_00057 [Clostridium sp. ATCC 29733]